jgi:hypothetical protein
MCHKWSSFLWGWKFWYLFDLTLTWQYLLFYFIWNTTYSGIWPTYIYLLYVVSVGIVDNNINYSWWIDLTTFTFQVIELFLLHADVYLYSGNIVNKLRLQGVSCIEIAPGPPPYKIAAYVRGAKVKVIIWIHQWIRWGILKGLLIFYFLYNGSFYL